MRLRDCSRRLAILLIVVLAGAGCGSTASSDDASPVPTSPSLQVEQQRPEATSEPVEAPTKSATEPVETASESASEPVEAPATAEASTPKITLDPVTVAPGESLCAVVGANPLDRLQLSLEFVGDEPLSAITVDYRVTIEGEPTEDTSGLGYVNQGEQIRILVDTSHRVGADSSLDDVSCEVLGVTQTPIAAELPITAGCETGELDTNGRLDVVITADTSKATSLAEDLPLVRFYLALYDSNGVRIDKALIPSLVLPADGSEARLHRRAFLPISSPFDLADYELSCEAFAFRISESLLAAAPDATCAFDGIDGFFDLTGHVDGQLEGNVDMWLAVVDPSGTWVGTTRTYVGPDFMEFETITPVPDGLNVSDLSCRVVGIEQ